MPRLPREPVLDWNDETAPRAVAFDDVYFSRAGGLVEAETVFLAGCGLPTRWADKDRFAIGELGFGSGLNVLAAWRAWKSTRKPHAILHISSIEAFPLARADAARALAQFPEVADLAAKLLARWPVRAFGPQRLWFPEDGFALTLHVGDVDRVLASLRGRFDAWFLDGFAPARNGAMWSGDVSRESPRFRRRARERRLSPWRATFGADSRRLDLQLRRSLGLERSASGSRRPSPRRARRWL